MKKKYLSSDKLHDAAANGHSHIISVRGGRTIYVSGQSALDAEGAVVGGDLATQSAKAWENVVAALDAADAEPVDIVSLVVHVKNYTPSDLAILQETIFSQFRKNKYPTRSIVGVQSLSRDDLLIEIAAIAVIE